MMNSKSVVGYAVVAILFLGLGFAGGNYMNSKSKAKVNEEDVLYAVFKGENIFGRDVMPEIKSDLLQLERNKYDLKKRAVENLVLKKQGPARPELPKDSEVSRAELTTFLKQRNLDFSKMTKKQQSDVIGNFKIYQQMMAGKKQEQDFLKNSGIEWRMPMDFLEPAIKVENGFLPPLIKTSKGKTLVIFGNYHCPYCPEAYKKIRALREKLDGKVNLYFRFAMAEPETSIVFQTAIATVCADEQGKFSEFFQNTFDSPPLDPNGLIALATKTSLDSQKFVTCMSSASAKKSVLDDIADAEKAGMARSAVIFVDGHPIPIQEGLENIEAVISSQN